MVLAKMHRSYEDAKDRKQLSGFPFLLGSSCLRGNSSLWLRGHDLSEVSFLHATLAPQTLNHAGAVLHSLNLQFRVLSDRDVNLLNFLPCSEGFLHSTERQTPAPLAGE